VLTEAQKNLRKRGVAASEVAAIAGLHPYASAWDVWVGKTAGVDVASEATELGELLEEPIAQLYARRHPDVELRPSDTLVHPEHPWALATPDRDVLQGGRRVRLLEIKHAGLTTMRAWGAEEDAIPEQHIAQVHWQMFVTGVDVVDVAALVAGSARFYRVARNEAVIAFLFEKAAAFMELLRAGTPPPLDGSDAAGAWLRGQFPEAKAPLREASDAEAALLRAYAAARAAVTAAERAKKRLAQQLVAAIGDAEGIAAPGARATYRAPEGATVKWEAVASEIDAPAEVIARHSTPMGRRLDVRLKGMEE
jgi:putative phage-type endonuclease